MELLFDEHKHQYSWNGRIIPSVTQIIAAVGLYEFDFVSKETLAIAAERGRIVHTYIEWYEKGRLDFNSIDPELSPYFEAYLDAKADGVIPDHPVEIEQRVYSERYKYAGTLDQLYEGDWIHDHKTGAPSPAHGLQLSAYYLAKHPDFSKDKPKKLTCGYYSRDGRYSIEEYPYEPLPWIAVLTDFSWRCKHNAVKSIWNETAPLWGKL